MQSHTITDNQPNSRERLTLPLIFSAVMVSTVVLIWLCRKFSVENAADSWETIAFFRVLLMGLALIWVRSVLEKVTAIPFAASRFFSVIILLFLPWATMRALSETVAVIIPELVYILVLVAGFTVAIPQIRQKIPVLPIVFGVLLAISLFTVTIGKGYITPFAFENTLESLQHRDTVYHAAIANMIEFHNSVSLGLDGLVAKSYHVLSHRLIGSIASWLQLPVLLAAPVFVSVITLPLLFLLFCEAVAVLKPKGWPPFATLPGFVVFLCWPMLFSLMQSSSYFSSESYILSLVIFFAVIPVMVEASRNTGRTTGGYLTFVTYFVAIFLASLAKISTGAVLAGGLAAFIILTGHFRPKPIAAALVFCIMPFLAILFSSYGAGAAGSGIISPLHFLFEWREPAIFHIVLIALTGLLVWKSVRQESRFPYLVMSLYLMALGALTASLLVNIPAGGAIYFANPGMWIAILLLAMLLPAPDWAARLSPHAQSSVVIALFAIIVWLEKDRWCGYDRLLDKLAQTGSVESSPSLNLVIADQVNETALKNGRDFLVFIAPDFKEFWKQDKICWAQPFVIPALTGQAMLNGLPPAYNECELTVNYGLDAYDQAISRSQDMDNEQACSSAAKRGFDAVMRFDNREGTFISCDGYS